MTRKMKLRVEKMLEMRPRRPKRKRKRVKTTARISMKLSGKTSERTLSSVSLRMQAIEISSLNFSGK